jgi:hypothetical protein
MTFPVYAFWKSVVYPAIAISVAPGLSFVQKWRMISPTVMPAGIFRTLLVPSVPTVVFWDTLVGYAGPDGEGVRAGVKDGVSETVNDTVRDGVFDGVNEGVCETVKLGVAEADGVFEGVKDTVLDGVLLTVREGVNEGVRETVNDGVNDTVLDGVKEAVRDGVRDGVNEGVCEGVFDPPSVSYENQTSFEAFVPSTDPFIA